MAISAPARRAAFGRRLLAACGLALTLTLTGCTGDGKSSTGSTASPTVPASVSASPSPSQSPSPSPSSPASATPAATPTAVADPTTAPTPSPSRPAHTDDGSSASGGRAAGTGCEIRSSAGNCYKAGQFCRTTDVGASTHDAGGRLITCGGDSGRPRWHY